MRRYQLTITLDNFNNLTKTILYTDTNDENKILEWINDIITIQNKNKNNPACDFHVQDLYISH